MGVRSYAAAGGRVVSLRGIEKRYLANPVFQDLDLDLQSGNFYALLGKNGSGKSTLMRILAHREVVTKGSGLVLGVDLNHDFGEIGNDIAYVSEANTLPGDLAVRELLDLNAKIFPAWDPILMEKLALGFQFRLDKKVGELSRGQQVQLWLLLTLSYSPSLILLDEVTSVLDASARGFLMRFLSERVRAGATVLLATNIVTEVQNAATALILLGDKHVKINAAAKAVAAEFRKLVRKADHAVFSSDACIEVGLTPGGEPLYLISAKDAHTLGVPSAMVSPEPITPAEVFIYLTRLRD